MKVVIADDEPLARRRLEALLADCDDTEVIASVGHGQQALDACEQGQPDLVILDIRMPGLDGLSTARRLQQLQGRTQIVFCTAFEEHAIDAWNIHASDYLLKPVTPARLQEALDRVRELAAGNRQRVWLRASRHGESLRIALDDVLWLQADDKYVSAHLADDTILLDDSLKSLLDAHPEHLVRLHRSCLVPRKRLLSVRGTSHGGGEARIEGSQKSLPISRRNLPTLRRLLRKGRRDGDRSDSTD